MNLDVDSPTKNPFALKGAMEDPEWEHHMLGPSLEQARRALAQQRRDGIPRFALTPLLEQAYRSVSFHQQRMAKCHLGLSDLGQPGILTALPTMTRRDVAEHFAALIPVDISDEWLARGYISHTSGSTGEPLTTFRDARTIAFFYAVVEHALAISGQPAFPPNGSIVLLDTFGHRPNYSARLPLLHNAHFFKIDIHCPRDELFATLQQINPHVIVGDPTSLAPLAEFTLESLKLVLSSAFALPAELSAGITQANHATVLEYYSTQETSIVALGCVLGLGFHALSGATAIEATASGEVLLTPLHNPSFCLLRYAPGDLVELSDAVCPCGMSGPTISRLLGRNDVTFATFDGRRFHPAQLTPWLSRLAARQFCLREINVGQYELLLDTSVLPAAAEVAGIETELARLFGQPVLLKICQAKIAVSPGKKPQPFVATTDKPKNNVDPTDAESTNHQP